MRSHRPLAALVAAATAALVLGGCFTGPRPSFVETDEEPTGDVAIDAVLDLLEAPAAGTFTATYTIQSKFGSPPPSFDATVARDDQHLSVTIGDVRFLQGPQGTQTCTVSAGTCEDGINDARISDVGVLHTFAKEAAAGRIRREAGSTTTPGEAFDATVADQQVACVRLNGAGGTTSFCALDTGWLASEDVAELNVQLTGLQPTADTALFSPGGA